MEHQYGLLGEHLPHSFSPMIYKQIGLPNYSLFEVSPEKMGDFLQSDRYQGLNVTIPYKKAVIPYLSALSEEAKKIGSVNVVTRMENGKLKGDNTDYYGFLYMVKQSGISLTGKKVLVLGSGGASLTAIAVAKDEGAKEVVVISRSGENNYQNLSRHADADVIINTTPVGMYPDNGKAPLSLELFPKLSGVLDLIYNPLSTALVLDAKKRGIPASGGLCMLVAQAKRAAELFTKKELPESTIPTVLDFLTKQNRNIVLIGMPGAGKSELGRRLAQALARPLFDIDAMIVKEAGRAIPEIFSTDGEAAFRDMETKQTLIAGKATGAVIAAGGGTPIREQNRDALCQNGFVVFVKRNLNILPVEGRPISQSNPLEVLYYQRYPIYHGMADLEVENNEDVSLTVKTILEAIS